MHAHLPAVEGVQVRFACMLAGSIEACCFGVLFACCLVTLLVCVPTGLLWLVEECRCSFLRACLLQWVAGSYAAM